MMFWVVAVGADSPHMMLSAVVLSPGSFSPQMMSAGAVAAALSARAIADVMADGPEVCASGFVSPQAVSVRAAKIAAKV